MTVLVTGGAGFIGSNFIFDQLECHPEDRIVCLDKLTYAGHPETLAGSVTSLMGCVRKAVELGIPLADAIRTASFNPAEVLKIDHRAGSLDIGKEASMVLLNQEDLSIRTVIFKGQEVKHEQTP